MPDRVGYVRSYVENLKWSRINIQGERHCFLPMVARSDITLTDGDLLIFPQSGFIKLLLCPRIEPTTLDLGSLSSAFDF